MVSLLSHELPENDCEFPNHIANDNSTGFMIQADLLLQTADHILSNTIKGLKK